MSNASRIIRKNRIARGLDMPNWHPFDPRMKPKAGGGEPVRKEVVDGRFIYETNLGTPYFHPYVCAVRRKPYNGNSDRMRSER